jgi:hypothetical protein
MGRRCGTACSAKGFGAASKCLGSTPQQQHNCWCSNALTEPERILASNHPNLFAVLDDLMTSMLQAGFEA